MDLVGDAQHEADAAAIVAQPHALADTVADRASSAVAVRERSAVPYLPHVRGVVSNLPMLARASAGSGFLALYLNPDPDGVIRHVPMLARVRDDIVPGFALELARVARSAEQSLVEVGRFGIESVTISSLVVATDRSGEVWPNFALTSRHSLSFNAAITIQAYLPGSIR